MEIDFISKTVMKKIERTWTAPGNYGRNIETLDAISVFII